MSDDNQIFIDEIIQLRLLYSIRDNMQRYSKGERTRLLPGAEKPQFIAENIVNTYFALLKATRTTNQSANVEKQIINHIMQQVNNIEFSFNPHEYHTTSRKEDDARKKETETVKKSNKLVDYIKKAIGQELKNRNKNGNDEYPLDAIPSDIEISKDNGIEYFTIRFADINEPLKIRVRTYDNIKGSLYYLIGSKKKEGLNNSLYKALSQAGKLILTKKQTSQKSSKKYSPSEYKKIAKIVDDEQIKKELEVFNDLSFDDQSRFIEAIKKRKEYYEFKKQAQKSVSEYTDKLKQVGVLDDESKIDKYGKLVNKLFTIPMLVAHKKSELEGKEHSEVDTKHNFIINYLASNKDFWNIYTKKGIEKDNENHSPYEKLLIKFTGNKNTLSSQKRTCSQIFDDVLLSSDNDIKKAVYNGFKEIQSMANPLLPRDLTAEIFTYGIFLRALKNPNDDKFKKMNKVLNEFGLNIKFEQIEITMLPDKSVTTGSEQYEKDRKVFNDTKKTPLHLKRQKEFIQYAKSNGVSEFQDYSVHHYIAHKYNAYIKDFKIGNINIPQVNDEKNYIITARQNLWNVDVHDLVHRFDTDGEFLLKNEDGSYVECDFNQTRRHKEKAQGKVSIIVPILQNKNGGNFCNLLNIADKNGHGGFYLSNDKSENIISIPEYCLGNSFNQVKVSELKKSKQKSR